MKSGTGMQPGLLSSSGLQHSGCSLWKHLPLSRLFSFSSSGGKQARHRGEQLYGHRQTCRALSGSFDVRVRSLLPASLNLTFQGGKGAWCRPWVYQLPPFGDLDVCTAISLSRFLYTAGYSVVQRFVLANRKRLTCVSLPVSSCP